VFDAFLAETFTGEVKDISKVSNNLSGVVTFPVTIKINDDKKDLLMYGLSANITIFVSEKSDILVLPSISVFEENGKSYVYAVDKENKEGFIKKEVNTGVSDYENIEIISGLNEGDEIFLLKPESEKTDFLSR